jgi:hypothetical protein
MRVASVECIVVVEVGGVADECDDCILVECVVSDRVLVLVGGLVLCAVIGGADPCDK